MSFATLPGVLVRHRSRWIAALAVVASTIAAALPAMTSNGGSAHATVHIARSSWSAMNWSD